MLKFLCKQENKHASTHRPAMVAFGAAPGSPRFCSRWSSPRPDREVLDGILWVLKTGAQWNELPSKYPPYQTCHRRFSEWVRNGALAELLRVLAQDMEVRGGISLEECFIDGTFASMSWDS